MKIGFFIIKNFILQYNKIILYLKYVFSSFIIIYLIYQSYYFDGTKIIQNININNILNIIDNNYQMPLYIYINYIKDCKKLKRYNKKIKKVNEYPFLSICLSAYNIEKYIEKSILSILNQSFQDFEIIIVNDFSTDNTNNIIKRLQIEDIRIKIINHNKNLGTYRSRSDAVLNAKGKYILFLDPDDLILNPVLFELLYYYNLKYNLDIIEFTVYHSIEEKKRIYYPEEHFFNHNHKFTKKFMYQPELSNILYYEPQTKNYSYVICRTLWNKLYRKDVLQKSIEYIGIEYYKKYYIIVVEDTLLNILNFHFANNYTNINLPGYMYNIRKFSISHNEGDIKHLIIESISFYLYFKIFLKYIQEFDKDRNFFFYELKGFDCYLKFLKLYNVKEYIKKSISMLLEVLNDHKSTIEMKNYTKDLIIELKK